MQRAPDGSLFCSRCWTAYCFICPECNEVRWLDCSRRTRDNVRICEECYRAGDTWEPTPSPVSIAHYGNIASKRKFGIELETHSCDDYRQLKGKTLFGAKYDCSVRGMEFFTPILYGDEGLTEVENFCRWADEHGYTVNDDCGYHLHLDMRDETTVQLRHVAYAYAKSYVAWRGLVSEYRACDSFYCHAPRYSASAIRDCRGSIASFFSDSDRYNYLNLQAYSKHKTFEVRLHDGTLHAKTIMYWIIAHTRFVDAVKDMTYDQIDEMFNGDAQSQFESLCFVWDNAGGQRISEFYRRRFRVHGRSRNGYEDD